MKKFLVLAALISTSAAPAFADTLATWTFESSGLTGAITYAPGANTATTNFFAEGGAQAGTATASALHATAATYSSPAGNGTTKSLSANNWSVGDYWQLQLSTVGFSGLSLSYDQTGSATGPRDFALSYSLNGTSFTAIGSTYSVLVSTWNATTPATGFTQSYDLGAFSDINNASTVYFRITDMSTTAINNGTVATGGTDRIDNFSVFTTPVPEPSSLALGILGGLAGLVVWKRRK